MSSDAIAINQLPIVTWAMGKPPLSHVYKRELSDGSLCGPRDFNPKSRARLACLSRSMYYAGSTPSCALWECPPLRSVVAATNRTIALHARQFWPLNLAAVSPKRDLRLIDLSDSSLRVLARSAEELECLRSLLRTPEHERTHPVAQQLLDHAALEGLAIDGFTWRSKQHDDDHVLLLFEPPMASDDFRLVDAPTALDDDDLGWGPIDRALAAVNLHRLTADEEVGRRISGDDL